MQYCARCKTYKEEADFNANAHQRSGKQPWCRECTTEYSRRWYEANREKHCAYVRTHAPKKVHTCKMCGRSEPDVMFHIGKRGDKYFYRFICLECDGIYKRQMPGYKEAQKLLKNKSRKKREKWQRADKRFAARYILADSAQSDKRRGMANDLTLDFVKSLIAGGCMYCGETELRMGLDRIDNSLGHTKSNVNPSCRRCNWLRRDMPYEAWLRFIPVLRAVNRDGLFGDWHAGPNKSPQFKSPQRKIEFGSLAQEAEQQSFKLQDETSSVSASTTGPVPDSASTRVTVTG